MKYLGEYFNTKDVHGIKCSGTCVSEHENTIILDTGFTIHKETVNPKHKRIKAQNNQWRVCFNLEEAQASKIRADNIRTKKFESRCHEWT